MKKLKVGLLMDTILHSDAGVQQIMKGLARYLLANGHEIKFIVPDSKDEGEFKGKIISLGLSFNPIFNTTSIPQSLIISKRKISNMLEKENFDIIHAAIPYNPCFGGRIITSAKCPVVATFMSYFKNDLHRISIKFLNKQISSSYKKIQYFIAPSPSAKQDAEKVIPRDFQIIPHAVELKNYNKSTSQKIKKYDDGLFNLLFLGRLEERKGVSYLLKAYKIIQSRCNNVRLILAGDGPKREELEMIVKKKKLKNVFFEGYIDENEKPNYYATADLCVFPAIYGECFGVVLIEAMIAGKVPVVFGNEGYSWVMEDIPELIVENRNYKALAEKIISLIENPERLTFLEKKCKIKSREYSWSKIGEKIVNIYNSYLK